VKTKKSLWPADFEYAEFSGDLLCPFCKALLHKKSPEIPDNPTEGEVEELDKQLGGSAFFCEHVGFWSFGNIDEPNVNDSWRKEMFELTKALKIELNDDYWPDALNFAIYEEGNIGWAAAIALPTFRVAVYKQFIYVPDNCPRIMDYMAVFLRKK
jgi:hypothetical protein